MNESVKEMKLLEVINLLVSMKDYEGAKAELLSLTVDKAFIGHICDIADAMRMSEG